MLPPSVVTSPPPGWVDVAAEVAPPPLGAPSRSTFTQWQAWRAPAVARADAAPSETLLLGCVATAIPGWVDDMRPSVDGRTVALMGASVARAVDFPVEARLTGASFSLRAVGAPETAPRVGIASTFVGWDEAHVVTCFAACATRQRGKQGDVPRGCDASVLAARLEDSRPPPPPGLALGAVTRAVHAPRETAAGAALLVFAAGAFAVASRRRPRSKI